jgi:hypothetical protein
MHHQERRAARRGVHVEDADDVAALEPGERAALAIESLDERPIATERVTQVPDRAALPELDVLALEHLRHAALAELTQDALLAAEELEVHVRHWQGDPTAPRRSVTSGPSEQASIVPR